MERSESGEIFNTRPFENFQKIDCSVRIVRKFSDYVTERENQNGASRRSVSLSFPRYRQWNDRNRVKFLIPGPLKI